MQRTTKETDVKIRVRIDGTGKGEVNTGVGFLNHMLESLAVHSQMDLVVEAKGDLQHHVVEDVAITLGQAIKTALKDRRGIRRFGYAIVPMDDALAVAAVDLVRRPYYSVNMKIRRLMVEDAPREDLEHFLPSLAVALEATIHAKVLEGRNDHHKFEAAMKAFAIALRDAMAFDVKKGKLISSSKGVL